MKKCKFINYLFIVLSVAIFSTSCSEKNEEDDGGNNGGKATTIKASGVINGSSKIASVKAVIDDYVIAEADYKDDAFTLELPATVSAKHLESMFDMDGITVSDNTVKGCALLMFGAYNKNDDDIGWLFYTSANLEEETDNISMAMWIYVDKKVTINGQYKDEGDDEVYIQKFNNLTLAKGWNIVYISETYSKSTKKETYTSTFSNQKPSGVTLNWYFLDYEDYGYGVSLKSAKSLPKHNLFSKIKRR